MGYNTWRHRILDTRASLLSGVSSLSTLREKINACCALLPPPWSTYRSRHPVTYTQHGTKSPAIPYGAQDGHVYRLIQAGTVGTIVFLTVATSKRSSIVLLVMWTRRALPILYYGVQDGHVYCLIHADIVGTIVLITVATSKRSFIALLVMWRRCALPTLYYDMQDGHVYRLIQAGTVGTIVILTVATSKRSFIALLVIWTRRALPTFYYSMQDGHVYRLSHVYRLRHPGTVGTIVFMTIVATSKRSFIALLVMWTRRAPPTLYLETNMRHAGTLLGTILVIHLGVRSWKVFFLQTFCENILWKKFDLGPSLKIPTCFHKIFVKILSSIWWYKFQLDPGPVEILWKYFVKNSLWDPKIIFTNIFTNFCKKALIVIRESHHRVHRHNVNNIRSGFTPAQQSPTRS